MGCLLVPTHQVLLNKRNTSQDLAPGLLDSDKILLQPSVTQEKSAAFHDKTLPPLFLQYGKIRLLNWQISTDTGISTKRCVRYHSKSVKSSILRVIVAHNFPNNYVY